jgi:hypothetical protein
MTERIGPGIWPKAGTGGGGGGGTVDKLVAGHGISLTPATGKGTVTITATGTGGGVGKIIAGTGITISPATGKGTVTVKANVHSVNGHTGAVVLHAHTVTALASATNLSDLGTVSAARSHLGLGTIAVKGATTYLPTTARGAATGVAKLVSGKVPSTELPTTVGTVKLVESTGGTITVSTGSGPDVNLAIDKVPSSALVAGTGIGITTTGGKAKITLTEAAGVSKISVTSPLVVSPATGEGHVTLTAPHVAVKNVATTQSFTGDVAAPAVLLKTGILSLATPPGTLYLRPQGHASATGQATLSTAGLWTVKTIHVTTGIVATSGTAAHWAVPSGGVTQLSAGKNISLSPSTGKGTVTVATKTTVTFSKVTTSTLVLDGVSITGAAATGQVLTATSTSAADWATPTGGGAAPGTYVPPGGWFPAVSPVTTTATAAPKSTGYFCPGYFAKAVKVTEVAVWKRTTGTGSVTVGVYSSVNGVPKHKLFTTTITLGSGTGIQTASVTETVPAGSYWTYFYSSVTPPYRYVSFTASRTGRAGLTTYSGTPLGFHGFKNSVTGPAPTTVDAANLVVVPAENPLAPYVALKVSN